MNTQAGNDGGRAPAVSFVMPLYNCEAHVRDAIAAVQAQSVSDWELVVVDDASADASASLAEALGRDDSRIRVIRRASNSGGGYLPRLEAVAASRARIVAPLDADDLIEPPYLATLLALKQATGAAIVYPEVWRMTEQGLIGSRVLPAPHMPMGVACPGADMLRHTVDGWEIGAAGGLIDRELFLAVHPPHTDPGTAYLDDLYTRFMIHRSPSVALAEARYLYRVTSGSVTQHVSLKHLRMMHDDDLLRDYIRAHYPAGAEERLLAERQKFNHLIEMMYYLNGHRFSRDERRRGLSLIEEHLATVDWALLRGRVSPRYYRLLRMPLPRIMSLLRLLGPVARAMRRLRR